MSWNIGESRNSFLRLKTKLGLYHVVLTTPKSSPTKITLTIAALQQLPSSNIARTKFLALNGQFTMVDVKIARILN